MSMSDTSAGRILLSDPALSWRVEQGCADVFLVDLSDGSPCGPLFHVLTVTEGVHISGLHAAEWNGGMISLLCQPRPGAVLHSNGFSNGLDGEHNGLLTDSWHVSLREAAELNGEGDVASVAAFHHALLYALAEKRTVGERSEAERLKRKTMAREATVHEALGRLTAVVERSARSAARGGYADSAILAACQALGRQLGLSIKSPKGFKPSADPLRDVGTLCRASGVRYREVSLMGEWWKKDQGPLLGFRIPNEESEPPVPVVLVRRRRGYLMQDPVRGSSEPLTRALAAELSASAVVLYRPFPARELTWRDLLSFGLFDTWRDVITMLTIGASNGLLALVAPIATGILFDTIIPGAQKPQLYQMAVLLFTTNMVVFLISLSSNAAMLRMEGRMEASIQSAVWDRLLSLPVRFFKQYNSGDLVERSLAIGQIRTMLTGAALGSILSGIFSIFSFLLLFRYSVSLALVATVLVIVAATVSGICGWLQMRFMRSSYDVAGKISGLVLETMTAIAKLRMSGTESQAFARWAGVFARERKIATRSARVSSSLNLFNLVFPTVTSMAVFYFGLNMMQGATGLTPGGFVAFNAAFGQFLGSGLGLANTVIAVIGVIPAYQRAAPILNAIPEVTGDKVDPGKLRGSIEASRLCFRYNDDLPIVINDISFHIKPGQFVAFVGASGSGKSTLFRLLLGFEKPESGFVHFDGMNLEEIDPVELRRQMGVVLQNGRLLDGDIFTNIVGSSPLSLEDAWVAARAAGLDRDIEAMPMKMHTVLSEGGGGLSGGQRQRLLIARAVVHRPRILLFDEATSALDNQTQAIVSQSLEQLNATRIVIAHRLSTIINADFIYVFDRGAIVQQGTYTELMEQDGPFRELARRQIA
jgi:NHLM bacteriocin system ABC transporter ATP-binding protein